MLKVTSNAIMEYFRFFQKAEKRSAEKKFLRIANDTLKSALSGASWMLYVTAVLLIVSCLYYYYFERQDRREYRRRIEEIRNIVNIAPPKRRPGAVAREREVYRNVLKAAHSYIYPENDKKGYVVRQTRSGTIYGQFLDKEQVDK